MVAVPKYKEVVVDGAVAAPLVVCADDVVCHSVVEHCVHCEPRQLVLGNAVADGRVATGDDIKNKGDDAVFAVAAGKEERAFALLVE